MAFVEGIGVERRGTVAIVTMSNPERRNAFYPDMRRRLTIMLEELSADREVRAIVLRGDGAHFSGGADVSGQGKSAAGADRTIIEARESNRDLQRLTRVLTNGSKPVIAAVEGAAAGGGMAMALACDIVVAARDARFVPVFTKIGIIPEFAIFYTLPLKIGLGKARRILMTSKTLTGEEAFDIGMADELAEPGGALDNAIEVAREFEDVSPLSLALIKTALARGMTGVEACAAFETDMIPLLSVTADTREAMAASREKRKPKFTMR